MANELGSGLVSTGNPPKIDQQAVLGSTATVNSLGYRLFVLNNHVHSPMECYGLTANTMARGAVAPIVITGGNGAFGTELEIHNGSTITSGVSFDINQLQVVAVGTANRVTYLEFYANTLAANIAATIQQAAGTFTKNGHGLANGTKLMLNTIVTTTGINIYTIYYVINQAANTFQLSLTLGGAAVALATGDGTCNYTVVTATKISELYVSRAATTSDGVPQTFQMDRQPNTTRISARAWANGGTNAVSFFLGLHTYAA